MFVENMTNFKDIKRNFLNLMKWVNTLRTVAQKLQSSFVKKFQRMKINPEGKKIVTSS